MKLKRINRANLFILMLMMVSALFLVGLVTQKEGMHVDEYLTYGLANHEWNGANKITPEYGIRLAAADVFDTFFYPDDFSLKNVWLNQGNDVHPPLYYLCFHIFILLTRHFLELKTGVLLNIMIHMINIWLVWLIMRELLSKECEAVCGTVLYAFTPIVLGNVLFIRMYVLVITFILGLTLLFIKGWSQPDRKRFYVKLGIISVGGTLTQYFFLVYLFYCCVIWGIYIISKRKWKELIVFIATMAASGIICLVSFPYMFQHIFGGGRGKESFGNLLSLSVFKENAKSFVKAIDNLYGGFLLAVFITVAALLVFRFIFNEKQKKIHLDRWMIVAVPFILYLLTITKIAVAPTPRYISPIYGVGLILLMGLFDMVISYLTDCDRVKCVVGILLVAVLLNNGYKIYTWTELHLNAEECVAAARRYGVNNECIYVLNISWHSFPAYQEFIQYQNMTFIRDTNLELLYTEDYADYDHVVMYFDKNVGEEQIEEILEAVIERNPGLDAYEKLHEYSYNVAYYLE